MRFDDTVIKPSWAIDNRYSWPVWIAYFALIDIAFVLTAYGLLFGRMALFGLIMAGLTVGFAVGSYFYQAIRRQLKVAVFLLWPSVATYFLMTLSIGQYYGWLTWLLWPFFFWLVYGCVVLTYVYFMNSYDDQGIGA